MAKTDFRLSSYKVRMKILIYFSKMLEMIVNTLRRWKMLYNSI